MLIFAITVTVLFIIIMIVAPLLANIKTPENLTSWYTSNFYKVLIPLGIGGLIIIWGVYFLVI